MAEFPDGKISEHDQGELMLAMHVDETGTIIVSFGKEVEWIGLDPETAMHMAHLLVINAQQATRTRRELGGHHGPL